MKFFRRRPLLSRATGTYCLVTAREDTAAGKVCEQSTEPVLIRASVILEDQKTVSWAEVVEKHQKDVETITQLEKEKSNLTDQVKAQKDAHRHLKSEYQEMIETLTNSEKLLKVSLAQAEEKHQKDVETITQLEKEKFNLTDQVKTLQDTVEDLGSQLCDTYLQCDELKNECEREQDVHRLLKSEYQEMMETLTNSEKLLKVSLTEAEEKHQKAVETIAQLEKEKSNLMYQVGALKDIREDLEYVQTELCEERDKIMDEYTGLKDTHNILQDKHKETEEKLKRFEELLMECEREQEAHRLLKSEDNEMMETLTNSEKFLMVSLAEAEEKHQKAVKTIAQLENEKSNLINQVGALKDTVEELEEVQAELRKDHDEIMDEYDQLWAIYNILQAKHKDMEEKLIICEELIIVEKLESHHAIKMERDELKKTLTANQKLLKKAYAGSCLFPEIMWINKPFVRTVLIWTALSLIFHPLTAVIQYSAAELLQLRFPQSELPPALQAHLDIVRHPRRKYIHRGSRRSFHYDDSKAIKSFWSSTRHPSGNTGRKVNHCVLAR
ncbi:hypothetical protein QTP70_015793 [Hemibagrus guttatus]|uniref:Uncharacterized protein n=1 Tax=Hemibagrus guttatus TaxID=175788 RepID=A0AAE0UHL4_9TELE|nr:hypothetical protein QTP70_015793 [Hemibagrus guttatus]